MLACLGAAASPPDREKPPGLAGQRRRDSPSPQPRRAGHRSRSEERASLQSPRLGASARGKRSSKAPLFAPKLLRVIVYTRDSLQPSEASRAEAQRLAAAESCSSFCPRSLRSRGVNPAPPSPPMQQRQLAPNLSCACFQSSAFRRFQEATGSFLCLRIGKSMASQGGAPLRAVPAVPPRCHLHGSQPSPPGAAQPSAAVERGAPRPPAPLSWLTANRAMTPTSDRGPDQGWAPAPPGSPCHPTGVCHPTAPGPAP